MKIRQISVFLENQPGSLSALCRALAEAGINLAALTLSDAGEFGLLRFITPEPERAEQVTKAAGFAAISSDVLALCLPNRPGGLAAVLTQLEPHGLSVEYMYAFARRTGDAVMITCFDDIDRAMAALRAAGVSLLKPADLFAGDQPSV
jgi:hypothetical protein